MRSRLQWTALILVVVLLFYWKLAFTDQFSLLMQYEAANQAYANYHFAATSIQQGIVPLWDPHTQSGRSFVGEMWTGLFYPPKLILYFGPLNAAGLFSEELFNWFFMLTHFVAACFMFVLARELGLNGFSAFVAALCFSLGGFLSRVGWPDMLDTVIWLPLIVFFLLRALNAEKLARAIFYAWLTGLGLGMAVLAGRLHIVMMDVLVVSSATVFFAWRAASPSGSRLLWRSPWVQSALVLLIAGLVAFAAGAIQLFPSIEFSGQAVRYLHGMAAPPATEKIPYAELSQGFSPRAFLAFLLAFPFFGAIGTTEMFSPYMGVLPLLLAILGVWQNWARPWVKYLAVLAVVAFLYTLGGFSFLHGLMYALVPYLWMAREPGRFIYLTHFAMALLAGFGIQALFSNEAQVGEGVARLARILKWLVIALGLALGSAALFAKPEVNDWVFVSSLFILSAWGLLLYINRGNRTPAARFLVVALILSDLNAFEWITGNKADQNRPATQHLKVLLGCRNLAQFLKSQPGLFRVQMESKGEPNIGDLYGLYTTGGMSAAMLKDYAWFVQKVPRARDLLNIRYVIRPNTAKHPNPVYTDEAWKVYENPSYCPRAWVVHQVVVEPDRDKLLRWITDPDFTPLRWAFVNEPLEVELPRQEAPASGVARFDHYQADKLDLKVRSEGRGLLVLSEVYYPGWQATVNGTPALIHKVNGVFRGIVVPEGESQVTLRYAPRSVLAGAVLTFSAFLGTLLLALALRRHRDSEDTALISRSTRPPG